MPSSVTAILTWLHAQASALFATFGNVAANRPEPARQVVVYVLALIVLAVGIPKLVKILKK